MARIGMRLTAAILAATATVGVLMGLGALAESESARNLLVVAMPEVAVSVHRTALLADSCTADAGTAAKQCATTEGDGAPVYAFGQPR